jgi:lipooligosaccharide transport system permease protein
MTASFDWQGAPALVDAEKIKKRGAWYVAEYRILNMSKWLGAIFAFGLGNPILYLASIGIGLGALVDSNTGGVDGVSYLVFLAPALLASAAIQTTMDEAMFPTMAGFVWWKLFWAMNATALTGKQIARGVMIAALIRSTLTVTMYWLVLVLFGAVDLASGLTVIPSALFCGWGFGSVILAISAFIKEDDGFFAVIGRFVIAPMFMFSGTFYPLENLPSLLQYVGWISPLWHATDIGRVLMYGREISTGLFVTHFAYLLVMGVIGSWVAGRQYTRRLSE